MGDRLGRVLAWIAYLLGVSCLAFVLGPGCCKPKPPVYLPAHPVLSAAPPARPTIPRVDPQHPEAYRCFTRDGLWELTLYLNAIRIWAEDAWSKAGAGTDDDR